MKKSKFTEQQIAFALRQAETGTKVKEIVRQMGITEQTFYRWKRKFGGLESEFAEEEPIISSASTCSDMGQ